MKINAKFIKGYSRQDLEKLEKEYRLAKDFLTRIRKEVEKEIESSYLKEEHLEELSLTKLADLLGYRRGLREVLTYLPEE